MNNKYLIYSKIKHAHNHLKCNHHHNEAFEASIMLSKLAQEQLEVEEPTFQKYRCSVCNNPEYHGDMYAAKIKMLNSKNITPVYVLPPNAVYPICSKCNAEYFSNNEYDERENDKPNYSKYRKERELDYYDRKDLHDECMKCSKLITDDDYEWETLDFGRINGIDITEEHIERANKIGNNNSLPLCYDCYDEIENDDIMMCAACGGEENKSDVEKVSRNLILETVGQPEYKLDNDQIYPVCYDCYDRNMSGTCHVCNNEFIITELTDEDFTDGSYPICESCSNKSVRCEDCNNIVDLDYGNYYMDEDDNTIYCEDHRPSNVNDLGKLSYLAKNISNVFNQLQSDHIGVSPTIIKKLENTFGEILEKNKGEYLSNKVKAHLIKIIDQLPIDKEEKMRVKELLFDDATEDGIPESPLEAAKLSALFGYVKNIEKFRSNIETKYDITKNNKFLNDIMPIPVKVEVDEPHSSDYRRSFAVVLSPNKKVIKESFKIWGTDGLDVWEAMSVGTHHSESVAYCRIGNYNGEWLIENIQQDSDVQRLKHLLERYRLNPDIYKNRNHIIKRMHFDQELEKRVFKIANWWSKQFKGWQAYLIMLVMQMAENSNSALFITDTDHQKVKWGSIPERSAIVYDALPKELNEARIRALKKEISKNNKISEDQISEDMVREYADIFPRKETRQQIKTEDSSNNTNYPLWRLARLSRKYHVK